MSPARGVYLCKSPYSYKKLQVVGLIFDSLIRKIHINYFPRAGKGKRRGSIGDVRGKAVAGGLVKKRGVSGSLRENKVVDGNVIESEL